MDERADHARPISCVSDTKDRLLLGRTARTFVRNSPFGSPVGLSQDRNRTNVRGRGVVVADPRDSLPAAVRARRRHLQLSQAELADLAGVSERFVYAVEHGKPSVQLDKLLAVLSVLGLHLELRRGAAPAVRFASVEK
jgi:HTH-type transcriptional regulator/antitoxin HipB